MHKHYNHKDHERDIYAKWKNSGFFNPDVCEKEGIATSGQSFSIILPPPNVTGQLHLGHASMLVFQDVMIRYHRMKGDKTLWLPGTDHAAIATQMVVEQHLRTQGEEPRNMTREDFVQRCYDWSMEYRGHINSQFEAMGASLDWSRDRFTMDPEISQTVIDVFHDMYRDGLIYRGARIVNWDPNMQTTVADDELEYKKKVSPFYTFQYGPFQIGTVRPETKFGDKYVIMNPHDERYAQYEHMQQIEVEWIFGRVRATIIKDEAVDPEFGTGVMTITPWHDHTDFEIAQRHNLDMQQIIGFDGHMMDAAGEFAGMPISEARTAVVERLKEKGLLVSVKEDYEHSVSVSYRGEGQIEPQIMMQWFVDVNKKIEKRGNKSLKELMKETVEQKDTTLLPKRFEKTYFHWVDNLRDWCISRQIWWGHRIPVWYDEHGNPTIDKEMALEKGYKQDEDTLDTWFSSGLWPFSTMGGPKNTSDMQDFFPNSVLETGHDILFFWVARMILMSQYIMGREPFETCYLHGMVCDEHGQKMSKSKGNGVDPLDAINEYGADALRMALVSWTTPGSNVNVGLHKIEGMRNFVTKIWNIYRFASDSGKLHQGEANKPDHITEPHNAWIVDKLKYLHTEVSDGIKDFSFGYVSDLLYDFTWNSLASWYLEASKKSDSYETSYTLEFVLRELVKLLHPYMPYVTELLHEQMGFAKNERDMLMVQNWSMPKLPDYQNNSVQTFELAKDTISEIRSKRMEAKVNPVKKIGAIVVSPYKDELQELSNVITMMANLDRLDFVQDKPKNLEKSATVAVRGDVMVYLPLSQMLDINEEKKRLQKEKAEIEKHIASIDAKLTNDNFFAKAPKEVVDIQKQKRSDFLEKMENVDAEIKELG